MNLEDPPEVEKELSNTMIVNLRQSPAVRLILKITWINHLKQGRQEEGGVGEEVDPERKRELSLPRKQSQKRKRQDSHIRKSIRRMSKLTASLTYFDESRV